MRSFEYLEPSTLDETLYLLERHGAEGKLLAGGTDLIVQVKQKLLRPKYIINLKKVKGLDVIESDDGRALRIGSLATLSKVSSLILPKELHALREGAKAIGTPQIRNLGTIGGNICNASPSADTAPALIALRAIVKIRSARGERSISIDQFFVAPYQTCLSCDEMITEIGIPIPQGNACSAYLWLPKYAGVDESLVGCATSISLEEDKKKIKEIGISLGAVSTTPLRAANAEAFLKGKKPTEGMFEEAGRIASGESCPIERFGISSHFRREMVRVLVVRALRKTISEIEKSLKA